MSDPDLQEVFDLERQLEALRIYPAAGDVVAVLDARRDQIVRHGHTIARDLERSPTQIAGVATNYIGAAKDHMMRNTVDDLDIALANLARAAAVILAAMRRTRHAKEEKQT